MSRHVSNFLIEGLKAMNTAYFQFSIKFFICYVYFLEFVLNSVFIYVNYGFEKMASTAVNCALFSFKP